MADLLIKTNMKYDITNYLFFELAECVRSGDKEDELEKHATSYTDR